MLDTARQRDENKSKSAEIELLHKTSRYLCVQQKPAKFWCCEGHWCQWVKRLREDCETGEGREGSYEQNERALSWGDQCKTPEPPTHSEPPVKISSRWYQYNQTPKRKRPNNSPIIEDQRGNEALVQSIVDALVTALQPSKIQKPISPTSPFPSGEGYNIS